MEVKVTQAERLVVLLSIPFPLSHPHSPINVTYLSPIAAAWQGAAQFMLLPNYDKCKVTKEEYQENGPSLCVRRFSMY